MSTGRTGGGYGGFSIGLAGSLENVIRITRNIKGYMISLDDVQPMLDEATELILDRIRARFLAQIDAEGNRWVRSQAAAKEGRATLYKTGNLYNSIHEGSSSLGGRTRVIVADAKGKRDFPYGSKLQTMNNWQFLETSEQDEDAVLEIIRKRVIAKWPT